MPAFRTARGTLPHIGFEAHATRYLGPVMLGVISLSDLAIERDARPALGDISAVEPNK